MPRNITPLMEAHLQQESTTLAACILIEPDKTTLKPKIALTEHDNPLTFKGIKYNAREAFNLSAIRTTKDFVNDNTEIVLGNKTLADVEGLKNANISIFYLNWQDTSELMGSVDLFFGFVTATSLDEVTGDLALTVSGMGKRLSQKYLPKYSRTCRTNVGSAKCGVPVLPVFRGDAIIAYPRTFEIGTQVYDRPNLLTVVSGYAYDAWCAGNNCTTGCPTTWTCTNPAFIRTVQATPSTLTQTIQRPVGYIDGDMLLFEVDASAPLMTLTLTSLDVTGTPIQAVTHDFTVTGKHNIATYVLPNSTAYTLEITVPENQAITVTPEFYKIAAADIPTTRQKLARITSKAPRDQILVPNGYFYKDPLSLFNTNFNIISDWDGTANAGGSFKLDGTGSLVGQDITVFQTITLPPLSCTSLSSGCYFFSLNAVITGGTLTSTVELLDDANVVLATHNSTAASSIFQMTNEPSKVKITYTFPAGGVIDLSQVEVYIYNALLSAQSDPTSIALASAGVFGTLNDIWMAETDPLAFSTTVTSSVAPYQDQVFIEAGNIPPTAKIGAVHFITGQNAGLSRAVRAFDHTTKQAELSARLPFPIGANDKIIMSLGCDRHILTCGGVFNNAYNFRGEPYIPGAVKLGQILGV